MLTIRDQGVRLCDGLTRRDWLHVGSLATLGLTLPGWLQARAPAAAAEKRRGSARACILLFFYGGPSHLDTWDPKPDAPEGIRGEIGSVTTRVGLRVSELMPRTAALLQHCCILRAMSTSDRAHASSGYAMMTGVPHAPLNQEFPRIGAPNDAPTLGAMVRYLARERNAAFPAAVTLTELLYSDGPSIWPGQNGGALGRRFDPWLLKGDPGAADYQIPGLALPEDVSGVRLVERQGLLSRLDQQLNHLERASAVGQFDSRTQEAVSLLTSAASRNAVDLNLEPAKVRDRYGRNKFGQSVLLARRLVQAGVTLVQVNWPYTQGVNWDTHGNNAPSLKNVLMPLMDQAYAALLEDLAERGMLDETLVVWMGEFGRSPKINARGGRDHWGNVFSTVLAGGGVRGGQAYGASDRIGEQPKDGVVLPQDLSATIFHCLGVAPNTELMGSLGRPLVVSHGQPLQSILA